MMDKKDIYMKSILLGLFLSVSSLFAFEYVTVENFEEKTKNKNVILDLYATWCPPCKVIGKTLKKYAESKPDDVVIYKIDIDKERELLTRFDVKSIPTLIYMKNGKVQLKEVGIRSMNEISANVQKYLR